MGCQGEKITSCKLRDKIQEKMQDAKTIFQSTGRPVTQSSSQIQDKIQDASEEIKYNNN